MRCMVRNMAWAVVAVAAWCGQSSAWGSDENPAQETKVEVRRATVINVAEGKKWIGVHPAPITDEALKAHLDLKGDRLIVVTVVPDSPAEKAGLKRHDILLKFGDTELLQVDDLLKAVNESGEKEVKLLILRGGKTVEVPIKPSDRPANIVMRAVDGKLPQELQVYVDQAKKEGDGKSSYTLRMFGPAVAGPKAWAMAHGGSGFPNGLSISVSKENDQPAKIVAKKDGKTYETTSDKLGELPDDIRPHVERLLNPPHAMAFSFGDMGKMHLDMQKLSKGVDGAKIHAEVLKAVDAAKKHAEEMKARHTDEQKLLLQRVDGLKKDSSPLDELRKEIEALRKELRSLKSEGGDKPEDKQEKKE